MGLHFDPSGGRVMDPLYSGNIFRNNGTAVLLESVPTDITLRFSGSRFSGNGTDIDDRRGQALDISEAAFE